MDQRLALKLSKYVGLDQAALGQRLSFALSHDNSAILTQICASSLKQFMACRGRELQGLVVQIDDDVDSLLCKVPIHKFAIHIVYANGMQCFVDTLFFDFGMFSIVAIPLYSSLLWDGIEDLLSGMFLVVASVLRSSMLWVIAEASLPFGSASCG